MDLPVNSSDKVYRENLFAVWSELCLFRVFFSCFRLRFWYIFLYVLYLISFCFETVLCVPSTNKCSPRNSVWERLLLRPSEWWLIDRKMTILMCRSELPNSKLRKVVRFFVFVLFVLFCFFPKLLPYSWKFAKTETSVGSRKVAEFSAPSRCKWTFLVKSAEESKLV